MAGRSGVRRRARLLVAVLGVAAAMPSSGATHVVTSLADSGPGTLREKVEILNNQLRTQQYYTNATITFAVSGVIDLSSYLNLLTPCSLEPCFPGGGPTLSILGDGRITIRASNNNVLMSVAPRADVWLSGLTFAGGRVAIAAGDESNLSVAGCSFVNNTGQNGAAITNYGELYVYGSTFEGNHAAGAGGAIASYGSRLTIANSTFYDNHANQGGAIFSRSDGDTSFSTFARNGAASGGGFYQDRTTSAAAARSMVLRATLVANSTLGGNCACSTTAAGCFVDNGSNLSYPDNTCPGIVGDPKLGPLADNGGATKTIALLAGSAAIDAAACRFHEMADQRGTPKPQGPACDIGAYEKSPITFSGFFPPISNPPSVNTVNAGRAIPIQFSAGDYEGMDIIAPGYPASLEISCATGAPTGDLVPIDTPGKSGLAYDAFSKNYTVVWKTEKKWENSCRQLVLRLTDRIGRTALFRFR